MNDRRMHEIFDGWLERSPDRPVLVLPDRNVRFAECREADGNEEILAFVEPKSGMYVDETALNEFVHERLAPYERPSRVIMVEVWPMTNSGKILKRELLNLIGPEATPRSSSK
jgi:acyl-CoA synthetase (AMP-forming)/AMP-acid ligase II